MRTAGPGGLAGRVASAQAAAVRRHRRGARGHRGAARPRCCCSGPRTRRGGDRRWIPQLHQVLWHPRDGDPAGRPARRGGRRQAGADRVDEVLRAAERLLDTRRTADGGPGLTTGPTRTALRARTRPGRARAPPAGRLSTPADPPQAESSLLLGEPLDRARQPLLPRHGGSPSEQLARQGGVGPAYLRVVHRPLHVDDRRGDDPVAATTSSAICWTVSSSGLPRLTGPGWSRAAKARIPATRSSTKQIDRVCRPSPGDGERLARERLADERRDRPAVVRAHPRARTC